MKTIVAMLVTTALAGCGSFVPVKNLQDITPEQKHGANSIRIMNAAQLQGAQFEVLTIVEGNSCQNKLYDPPASRAGALDQIKYFAYEAGGNAISNMQCSGREGTSTRTNCWELISCTAEVIKLKP